MIALHKVRQHPLAPRRCPEQLVSLTQMQRSDEPGGSLTFMRGVYSVFVSVYSAAKACATLSVRMLQFGLWAWELSVRVSEVPGRCAEEEAQALQAGLGCRAGFWLFCSMA